MHTKPQNKKAIMLAMFGSTHKNALNELFNIENHIKMRFPDFEVKIAFTSNQIRNYWRKQSIDFIESQGLPLSLSDISGILGTIGRLNDDGFREIIVQPTHLYHGEQFIDLSEYIRGLNSIKTVKDKWLPFAKPIALGRPLLGTWGTKYDYKKDIKKLCIALKYHAELAEEKGSALVYMAHGNEYMSSGIFIEFQKIMQNTYNIPVYCGTMEGHPDLAEIFHQIALDNIKNILLTPLLVTAGDHVKNDMTGEKDSWQSFFLAKGLTVNTLCMGLASLETVAEIFAGHIIDAAGEVGILI
jgi:sirohydrochlorin cobaltochelatase